MSTGHLEDRAKNWGGGVSGQMRLGEESHKGLLSLLDVLRIKKKGKGSESYLHSHVTAEDTLKS